MSQFTVEAFLKATGAKEFSNSMKEAGESVNNIGKNTKSATGGLGSFMSGIGKIAGAIGVTQLVSAGFVAIKNSVGDAVDRVDTLKRFPQMMEAMGFSADDSTKAVNKLKDGIQGLPTPLDDVVSTAQKLAIMTGDLEGATDVTLALNNAFLANGSSSADAQRGLQQYTQMLSSGKVDMQSWRTLQETMGVALDKTAKSFGFAGESAQNDLYAALQDGSITFEDFNNKIVELDSGVGGFAEMAQTASKGIKTSMTNIKTAITTGVGNAIIAVDEAMQAGGFGSISDNLNKVKVKVQEAFAVMVEAIGPFIGKLIEMYNTITESTAFQSLVEVFGLVKDKFIELKDAFLESEAFETIKQTFEDLGQAILDIDFVKLVEDVGAFLEKWAPLIGAIAGGIGAFKLITGAINGVKTAIDLAKTSMGLLSGAITFFTSPVGLAVLAIGILIGIGILLYQNWDTIKAKLGELKDKFIADWEELKNIVGTAMTTLKDSALEDFEELKTGVTDSVETLKTSAIEDFNELKTIGSNAMETLKTAAVADANELKTGATNAVETLKSSAVSDFNELKTIGSNAVNNLKNSVVNGFNTAKSNAVSSANNLKNSVVSAFNSMVATAGQKISELPGKVRAGFSQAISAASGFVSQAVSVGGNLISGFIQGVTAKASALVDSVKSAVSGAINAAKSLLGIHSPSRVFKQFGIYTDQGFIDGIDSHADKAKKAMGNMINGVVGVFNPEEFNVAPQFDINGSIARSNAQVKSSVSHELNNNTTTNKQPADLTFNLGNKSYRAFVDDISNSQNAQIQLTESYL